MKKILFALMGMVALALTSCSDDDNEKGDDIQNFWTLTLENKDLYDTDTEGVKVTVTLAYTAAQDFTLTPLLVADEALEGAFEVNPGTVTIATGEKTAEFYVRATGNKVVSEAGSIRVSLDSADGLRAGDGLTIHVSPSVKVELNDRQKALVETWLTNYGFDVRPFLGNLTVRTSINFSDDDKAQFNDNNNELTYADGISAITISDQATEEKIVLKMMSNPMGMQAFIRNMFGAVTVYDEEYWQEYPVAQALLTLVDDTDPATMTVTLDGIVLDPATGSLDFTTVVVDDYDEEITIVPFTYDYPAWNILKQKAEAGEEVEVDEYETMVSYPVAELIEQDGTLNPEFYLGNSNIATDVYEHEPSNFTAPVAAFNLENGTMTFSFAWDFGAGSWLYDYVNVNVTYTLNQNNQ